MLHHDAMHDGGERQSSAFGVEEDYINRKQWILDADPLYDTHNNICNEKCMNFINQYTKTYTYLIK